jgi:hypothetical protein
MKHLPVELLYCVGEFLDTFDKINMNYALNIKIPIKCITEAVNNICNDENLQLILYKIVTIERRIDNLEIIKNIFEIIKHDQICFSFCNLIYKFNISKGEPLITQTSDYNFTIICKNPYLLEKILVKYFKFETTPQKQVLSFQVKCNIKYLLPRGH